MSRIRFASEMLRDERGNVAILFGLMIFVIFGGAGLAIDMQRSNAMRAEVAEATDAAILAAARYRANHPNATDAELSAVGRRVFDHGITNESLINISKFEVTFDDGTDTFTADVDGKMHALIMGILGRDSVDISTVSEVKLGKPPLLEIALALDVTGSMKDNGKLSTLKDAANDLVETMFESEDADVKIGIAPFAQYVNVGVSNKGASWLSGAGAGWVGCVGSRSYPHNVEDSNYLAFPAPGVVMSAKETDKNGSPTAIYCPSQILPLTDKDNFIKAKINGLVAQGSTYIPAGLSWGWALLTPEAPYTEALPFDELKEKNGYKALILMTDGQNTRSPTYPLHEDPANLVADQLTKELCVNIKAEDIVVYTIAFQITDTVIKDILETCATSSSHYFDAAHAEDLTAAFSAIANSLRNIALSN